MDVGDSGRWNSGGEFHGTLEDVSPSFFSLSIVTIFNRDFFCCLGLEKGILFRRFCWAQVVQFLIVGFVRFLCGITSYASALLDFVRDIIGDIIFSHAHRWRNQ